MFVLIFFIIEICVLLELIKYNYNYYYLYIILFYIVKPSFFKTMHDTFSSSIFNKMFQ